MRIICSSSRIPTLENEAYAVLLHRHGPSCHCCMRNNRCVCPEGPGCVIHHPLPQVPCMSCHAASHLKQCPMAGEQMECTGLTIACVQSPCGSLKKKPHRIQIRRNNQITATSQPLAKSVGIKSRLAISNQLPKREKCKSDKWFQGSVQTKPGAVAKKARLPINFDQSPSIF